MRRHRIARRSAALLAAFVFLASCMFAGGKSISRAEEGPEDHEITAETTQESWAETEEETSGSEEEVSEPEKENDQEEKEEETTEKEEGEEETQKPEEEDTREQEGETSESGEKPSEDGKNLESEEVMEETETAETPEVSEVLEEDLVPLEAEDFRAGIGLNLYFREHLDPAYIPAVEKKEFVDFLDVRLTFVEAAYWRDQNQDGCTDLMDVAALPDFYAHMLTLPGIGMFYDFSDSSDYIAAMIPCGRDLMYPLKEVDFVVNNNAGLSFPADWHYDRATHILYARKDWFESCTQQEVYMSTRLQSVFLYDGDDFSVVRTVPVTSSINQGKSDPTQLASSLFQGVVTAYLMNEEGVRFRLFKEQPPVSITRDMLTVYVNGESVQDFGYDPASGEISVAFPLLALSDVHVDIRMEEADLLKPRMRLMAALPKSVETLLKSVTKDIFKTSLEFTSIPEEGGLISFDHSAWIPGSNSEHTGNVIAIRYDHDLPEERFDWDFSITPPLAYFKDMGSAIDATRNDPEAVIRFLSDKTAFGYYGEADIPYPVIACYDFALSGAMKMDGKAVAELPDDAVIQLYCTHATYADAVAHGMRDITEGLDNAVNGTILKVTDPGEDGIGYIYAAFGSNDFGDLEIGYVQAQFGVGRFPYRILDAGVRIKKSSARLEITDRNPNYSLSGITFGVYRDEGLKEKAGELVTGKDGMTEVLTLLPGTYYLKEESVPENAGYRCSDEVKKLELKGGETADVEFKDEPVYAALGLKIQKTDADGVSVPGYDMSGAVFRVSHYQSGEEDGAEADAVWEITTEKDTEGTFSAVLKEALPLGTYVIEEIKAPAGYSLEGTAYSLSEGDGTDKTKDRFVFRLEAEGEKLQILSGDLKLTGDQILILAEEEKKAPQIRTVGFGALSGTDLIPAAGEEQIVDRVIYTGLIPGADYLLSGSLVDACSEEILAEETYAFVPEETGGEVLFPFETPLSIVEGKTVVITETLYYLIPDEVPEDSSFTPGERFLVAEHKDLTEPNQTVYIPKILTTAAGPSGEKELEATDETVIVDEVFYYGLKPGETYRVEGAVIEAASGKPALDDDGNEITCAAEFTAEAADGSIQMIYTFPGLSLAGKKLVAFERLLFDGEDGELILAVHEDPEDPDQTVTLKNPPEEEIVILGIRMDGGSWRVLIPAIAVLFGTIGLLFLYRRKQRCN